MRGRLVFLLEEPSMKHLLAGLLPRLVPGWVEGEHFLCVPHEGKSDLDRSVPRKLAAWQVPGDRFVVLRDNDAAACEEVKARLVKLCADSGRPDTLVRLACQELEPGTLATWMRWPRRTSSPSCVAPRCASALSIQTPGKSLLRRFSVYCLPSIRARARGGWALLCAAPRKTGLAAFRCSWRGGGVWRLRWAGSLPERAKVCGRRHSMGLAIAGAGRTLAKCPKKSMTCGLAC